MNSKGMQLQIAGNRILHEAIDNEVLLIDSETGAYYILRESGAQIWQLISQGISEQSLLQQLACHYGMSVAELQPSVQLFLNELQAAELITQNMDGTQSHREEANGLSPQTIPAPIAQAPNSGPFTPPELHTFNDMNNLLLIDPIHEVAATGWPFATKQVPT